MPFYLRKQLQEVCVCVCMCACVCVIISPGFGPGYDDIVVHGDLTAPQFAAFYTK